MPHLNKALLIITPIITALAVLQPKAHAQVTDRVSVDSYYRGGDSASDNSQISSDGRHVAFASIASNLVAGDSNGKEDVFVRDRLLGTTVRVSTGPGGVEGDNDSGQASRSIDISADGRWVVFSSLASNLVSGDSNGIADVFLHDRDSDEDGVFDEGPGLTILISKASDGAPANHKSGEHGVSISGDGSKIAFSSYASNLAADYNGIYEDMFVWHRSSGGITNASIGFNAAGEPIAGADGLVCGHPDLSDDGSHLVFQSDATNLLGPGESFPDINGKLDVFYSTTGADSALTRVRASLGHLGNLGAGGNWGHISGDESQVLFESAGASVTPGTSSGRWNVYVRDIVAGVTTRLSALPDGSEANNHSYDAAISSDGRYVSFMTLSTNLFVGDPGHFIFRDLVVVDRDPDEDGVFDASPSNAVIALAGLTYAGAPINYDMFNGGISGDGRVLVYSSASSLVVHHDTNGTWDVFVHDLDSGCAQPTAFCESRVNSTGVGAYLGFSGSASVSTNDLSLEVNGGVPGKVGLFFYGAGTTDVAFGNGIRCVSGGSGGLFRIYPPLSMDSVGHAVLPSFLDKKPCDTGPGAVTPGAAWNFQFWYRDPGSTQGSTFNLSNALRISFCM